MAYEAKVLCDSISPERIRLLTMQVTYPRFVHSEFMTHRVFSRNAASSRAIPVKKMIQRVMDDPVMPVEWGLNQPGMQAYGQADEVTKQDASTAWLRGRNNAVKMAETLDGLGIAKQIVNRGLEPWSWITVTVSGTEWDGFFQQRASRYSPLAQPELRKIADMMLEAYEASIPLCISYGEWHTPYIQEDEDFASIEDRKRVSVARCARTSYLTQDGARDYEKDLELYERLVSAEPMHASPLEHVATPGEGAGNFNGWRQMRHEVEAQK